MLLLLSKNCRFVHDFERTRKFLARSPDEFSCSLNLYSVNRLGANDPAGDLVE